MKPRIALITPALATTNNGNGHTAGRWASMLADDFECDLALSSNDLPHELSAYSAMLALHARRSASSMAAFADACPTKPIILALTGTDLYRDIAFDAAAQRSLELANALIVLHEQGANDVPAAYRYKTNTVVQSCVPPVNLAIKPVNAPFEVVVVGHLRAEKAPETVFATVARLAQTGAAVRITHLGAGLDAQLASQAQSTQAAYPAHYRWLGTVSHADSLRNIANANVLLHPSTMEGGANAVIEAVQHATPVIASRISGNMGLLGDDYAGYFAVHDDAACAQTLRRAANEPDFLGHLARQCALRSPLFSPEKEKTALLKVVRAALQSA